MLSESEHTVLSTRRFLEDVSSAERPDIPDEVRRRARELLSRYPENLGSEDADGSELSQGEPTTRGLVDTARQASESNIAYAGPRSTYEFSRPPPYPTQAEELEVVVTNCWTEPSLVWFRDNLGRRYVLDENTRGVALGDLKVGQGLSCELAMNGARLPTVVAARVIPRRYPKDGGC